MPKRGESETESEGSGDDAMTVRVPFAFLRGLFSKNTLITLAVGYVTVASVGGPTVANILTKQAVVSPQLETAVDAGLGDIKDSVLRQENMIAEHIKSPSPEAHAGGIEIVDGINRRFDQMERALTEAEARQTASDAEAYTVRQDLLSTQREMVELQKEGVRLQRAMLDFANAARTTGAAP